MSMSVCAAVASVTVPGASYSASTLDAPLPYAASIPAVYWAAVVMLLLSRAKRPHSFALLPARTVAFLSKEPALTRLIMVSGSTEPTAGTTVGENGGPSRFPKMELPLSEAAPGGGVHVTSFIGSVARRHASTPAAPASETPAPGAPPSAVPAPPPQNDAPSSAPTSYACAWVVISVTPPAHRPLSMMKRLARPWLAGDTT